MPDPIDTPAKALDAVSDLEAAAPEGHPARLVADPLRVFISSLRREATLDKVANALHGVTPALTRATDVYARETELLASREQAQAEARAADDARRQILGGVLSRLTAERVLIAALGVLQVLTLAYYNMASPAAPTPSIVHEASASDPPG